MPKLWKRSGVQICCSFGRSCCIHNIPACSFIQAKKSIQSGSHNHYTKENIKLYWLGLFYNLFLPGGVGGDGFKVYLLGKYKKSNLKTVIGAILSDRVSGLSIIVILLLVFIPMLDYIPFKNLACSNPPGCCCFLPISLYCK